MEKQKEEKYYLALSSNINGYRWTIFVAYPHQATAEETGFVAVGRGYDCPDAAENAKDALNCMFGIR